MRVVPVLGIVAALFLGAVPAAIAVGDQHGDQFGDLGRRVLAPRDGWAAHGAGTTGGSAAGAENVHVVNNRTELVAALGGATPSAAQKIIYVSGTVDGNTDDANRPLDCADYADPAYRLEDYLREYDPATWGRVEPSGPLEEARVRSQRRQAERVVVRVGSNTTIVGKGANAVLRGLTLRVEKADNVIIRNLSFVDAHDCFPQWDPTDGALGAWNSEYDNLVLAGSTHVWVDHNDFHDGNNTEQPEYFGRKYEVHDGLFDIVQGSDFVTASYNRLRNHDKTMLIGSTDRPTQDQGKLRVTLHHNWFDSIGQRAPRVRYGQVHVYNNLHSVPGADGFSYAWGVGVESRIFAENNFFAIGSDVTPASLIKRWGGTVIHAKGTVVADRRGPRTTDLVAAYNEANDPDLGGDVGWRPELVRRVDPTMGVPALVMLGAGAGRVG